MKKMDQTAKAYITGEWSETPGGFQARINLLEDGRYYGFDGKDWDLEVLRRRARGESPWEKKKQSEEYITPQENEESLARSRRKLDKILRRAGDVTFKFLTLTYEEEPPSFSRARQDVAMMARRVREKYDIPFSYIRSTERGGLNGRIHHHLLVLCPYIDKEEWADTLWKKGFIKIKKTWCIKDQWGIKNLINYMAKYLCKDDKDYVKGAHRFDVSEGFPDVSERFRIYYNTSREAIESSMNALEGPGSIFKNVTFETKDKKTITTYLFYTQDVEDFNKFFTQLTVLANIGHYEIVKDALHPPTPSPKPVSDTPTLPAKDSVAKLDTTIQLGLF